MNLELSGQTLAIEHGTGENFRKFMWSTSLDLNKVVLLDDVRHLLLLQLTLVRLLLELLNLLREDIEPVTVS